MAGFSQFMKENDRHMCWMVNECLRDNGLPERTDEEILDAIGGQDGMVTNLLLLILTDGWPE